jgi:hypothetical protein
VVCGNLIENATIGEALPRGQTVIANRNDHGVYMDINA